MMRLLDSMLASLSLQRRHVVPIASVTGATAANNLVGFVVNIVVARKLGPEAFGVFSLAFSVAALAGVIGDFGLNLTMIRLFNDKQAEPEKQTVVLGTALCFKVLFFILVVVACLPFGSLLTRSLSEGSAEALLFPFALVTGGLLFFWTYLQYYLQSHRSFGLLTRYILSYAGLRVACLLVTYRLSPDRPLAWLAATCAVPITILVLIGVIPIGRKVIAITIKQPHISLGLLKDMLSYSKWVALSVIAYSSLLSVLRFILAARASVAEVGILSAGLTFSMAFSMLNTAVRTVLFPQVTALESPQRMESYLARIRQVAPYYAALAIVGITGLGLLQWFVLGAEYRAALPVFLITATTLALVILLGLGTMLVHTMMRPQIDAGVNIGRLALMVLLALILTPSLGALGAAVAYAVPLLAGEIWMFRYVKHKNAEALM